MARVDLEHLTKAYQGPRGETIRAVDQVDLAVQDHELLVLVGPSAGGKTTVLRLVAGLEEPTAGRVTIEGRPVNQVAPKDRNVEMVFQHYALYPHMSVNENLSFGLKVRGLPRAEIEGRVKETAEALGLANCLKRRPSELSGGQRQRVAVGRALVRRPEVLLFDEPLSNLDPHLRQQMRDEISRLHRRSGTTMIYVTHDQVEAMTLGDRIAVMKDGAIEQVATPKQLYERPANVFVAGFIGTPPMNFLSGLIVDQGHGFYFQGGPSGTVPDELCPIRLRLEAALAPPLRSYVGKTVTLGIRPEDLCYQPEGTAAAPEPTVEFLVEAVQPMGFEAHVHLVGENQSLVARVSPSAKLCAKQRVRFAFRLRNAHFFEPRTGKTLIE